MIAPTLASRRQWPGGVVVALAKSSTAASYIGNLCVTLAASRQKFVRSGPKPNVERLAKAHAAPRELTSLDRAVLHKMANDCSQHLWSFSCDVLE